MIDHVRPLCAALGLAGLCGLSLAEDIAPTCPDAGATPDVTSHLCTLTSSDTCNKAGGKWDDTAHTCNVTAKPGCPGANRGITLNEKSGKCQIDTSIPKSEDGAYTGDTLIFPIKNLPTGVDANTEYCVISQTKETDPKLLMVKGERSWMSCKGDKGQSTADVVKVPVTDLEGTGFKRMGWTYGALFLPYKYRLKDKEFSAAGQLGPYLGYRTYQGGFAINVVSTVAYGPITTGNGGNSPTATNTPSVKSINGLAAAIGLVGTLGKGASPFQWGIVWGVDKVSSSDRDAYPYTGKHWLALQLGYDWTAGY